MFDNNKARLGKRHDPFDAIATCAVAKTMSGDHGAGSSSGTALADR